MGKSKKSRQQGEHTLEETTKSQPEGEVSTAEIIKKSEMEAKDHFDYQKLVYPMPGLLECTYEETLEEVRFQYCTKGKRMFNKIASEEREQKYQLLINFALLWETVQNYKISFAPENLYYDENHQIYAKSRDIYGRGQKPDEAEFLAAYQSVVGGILSSKYSVEQIQKSGLSILKEEKGFEPVYQSESSEVLAAFLREKDRELTQKKKAKLREVSRRGYTGWRIVAIVAAVLMLGGGAYSVYASQFVIPQQQAVIGANQAYIEKDYVSCIDSLKGMEPDQMDKNTKYILAVSYASSESFKKEEIQTIVDKLNLGSNEKELDYWIYLGRLDTARAQDIALSLSDDKLLVYAYMKESDLLESNTNITGEEKKTRLDKLEKEITDLGKKYEEAEIEEDK